MAPLEGTSKFIDPADETRGKARFLKLELSDLFLLSRSFEEENSLYYGIFEADKLAFAKFFIGFF